MRLASVDLTKAFDLLDRDSLFILQKAGSASTLISLIKTFHHAMNGNIRYNGGTSGSFAIKREVKQGCVLAPTLFPIFFA